VPESPWLWVGGGVGLAIVGMLFVYLGETEDLALAALLGYATAGVGWVAVMVGVIAAGVRLGGQHLDHTRARRSAS
jgi:hypothetical protein